MTRHFFPNIYFTDDSKRRETLTCLGIKIAWFSLTLDRPNLDGLILQPARPNVPKKSHTGDDTKFKLISKKASRSSVAFYAIHLKNNYIKSQKPLFILNQRDFANNDR